MVIFHGYVKEPDGISILYLKIILYVYLYYMSCMYVCMYVCFSFTHIVPHIHIYIYVYLYIVPFFPKSYIFGTQPHVAGQCLLRAT